MSSEWHARWREGRIGFHQDDTNVHLLRYESQFPQEGRVLLPLCGKSRDVSYLAKAGYEAVGVELVDSACLAFFEEQQIAFEQKGRERVAGRIRMISADFFDVTPEAVGPVAWAFDRASLIALPPEVRKRYVPHLLGFTQKILLVTLDYDQQKMSGPPYAVPDREVYEHFSDLHVEKMAEADVIDERPRWRERGLDWLRESVFVIGLK